MFGEGHDKKPLMSVWDKRQAKALENSEGKKKDQWKKTTLLAGK